MKAYTKECHTWLIDNNVHVYGSAFDYKGHGFLIERAGTKFYCVDYVGTEYKPAPVKVVAIRWACEAFDRTIVNVSDGETITIAQFGRKAHAMYLDWVNNFIIRSIFAQHYGISDKAADLIIDLGRLLNNYEFLNDDCK